MTVCILDTCAWRAKDEKQTCDEKKMFVFRRSNNTVAFARTHIVVMFYNISHDDQLKFSVLTQRQTDCDSRSRVCVKYYTHKTITIYYTCLRCNSNNNNNICKLLSRVKTIYDSYERPFYKRKHLHIKIVSNRHVESIYVRNYVR